MYKLEEGKQRSESANENAVQDVNSIQALENVKLDKSQIYSAKSGDYVLQAHIIEVRGLKGM
jgi:hypothetical protein